MFGSVGELEPELNGSVGECIKAQLCCNRQARAVEFDGNTLEEADSLGTALRLCLAFRLHECRVGCFGEEAMSTIRTQHLQ